MPKTISMASRSRRTNTRPAAKPITWVKDAGRVFVRRDRDAMLMVFGIVGIVPPRIFLVIRPV
jgi:hypothetical protein